MVGVKISMFDMILSDVLDLIKAVFNLKVSCTTS